jgi:hypothetical protein
MLRRKRPPASQVDPLDGAAKVVDGILRTGLQTLENFPKIMEESSTAMRREREVQRTEREVRLLEREIAARRKVGALRRQLHTTD